jgi:hypothetical protein
MVTYILIPGAGGAACYWYLLEAELRERGHEAVAVDLPADDDSAGLSEYADAVVRAIGDRTDLVLVAQSFGGFTAPLVCKQVPVDLLVMLNAMVPSPGEAPGAGGPTLGTRGRGASRPSATVGISLPSRTCGTPFSTTSRPR